MVREVGEPGLLEECHVRVEEVGPKGWVGKDVVGAVVGEGEPLGAGGLVGDVGGEFGEWKLPAVMLENPAVGA